MPLYFYPMIPPFQYALPLLNTGLMLSIAFTALMAMIYYVAYFVFSDPDLKARFREELDSTFNSFLFFILLIPFSLFMESVFSNLIDSSGNFDDQFVFAFVYISNSITNIFHMYKNIAFLELGVGVISGFGISAPYGFNGMGNPTFSFSPVKSLAVFNNINSKILYFLSTALAGFLTQEYLLHFARATMLSIFLPFGFLLRLFPFTRKAGSNIIALALSFYYVFPLSYSFFEKVSFDLSESRIEDFNPDLCTDSEVHDIKLGVEDQGNYIHRPSFFIRMITYFASLGWSVLKKIFYIIIVLINMFLISLPSSFGFSVVPFIIIYEIRILTGVLGLLTLSLFTLFFSVNLTYVSYRVLSVILGSEPELYGFSKFL